ncbi:MAG: methionine biosynthesis protein MetW [Gammaproteobacteria bacterium]|nr:MAG: methionine biosynthesis protein MetW [Gammaproteobacteria bacterium]|tara:strand:- start:548 stop:1135 length:588 start_codon:yes stop_codon:yes gene_type:complete
MNDVLKSWIPKNSEVLDLGCGDGSLLASLKDDLDISGYGVDISEKNIELSLSKGLNVIEQDIDAGLDNFMNSSFDIVIMSQSIQALKKPENALKEIVRIGSECIVSIPNFANLKCRIQLALTGKMPVSKALPHEWYSTPNLHLCSLKDFESLCEKLNIQVIERKLIRNDGKHSIFMKFFPNLFTEVALYKLKQKL